jgi:spermidine synthase
MALPRATTLLTASALSGGAVMAIELSAVRLLAPWFGTSQSVWSNVIGVVMLGLSLGYLLGGRASRSSEPSRALIFLLGAGAVFTACLPFAAGPVAELFLPDRLRLDSAAEVFRWGSLATSVCLFLPASILLGGVGPLVAELISREGDLRAGEAGGRMLFASTVGSLVGVFSTSHWAIPSIGIRATVLTAASILLVASLLVRLATPGGGRKETVTALLLLVGALGAMVLPRSMPQLPEGFVLLEERESPYQYTRLVEDQRTEPYMRSLQVNEGTDSYQSVWQPELGLLDGDYYYNDFVLPAWWQRKKGTWRCLTIGMGAGTAKRVMAGAMPEGLILDYTGIELDPVVVEMAEKWCDLASDDATHLLSGLDGRAALGLIEGRMDHILVDAYANQVEIPPHLATVEFFDSIEALLEPAGWCQVNVSGFSTSDPMVAAIASTVSAAFEAPVLILRVPGARNCSVFARRDSRPPIPTAENWIDPTFPESIAALLGGREVRGQWDWVEVSHPKGVVLTDDLAPVELLQQRSLQEARHSLLGASRNVDA